MLSIKTALITGLAAASFASGAAFASDPDEYTLAPIGVGSSSSTVIYTPETYTTGTTIQTQPAASGNGQPETVDINDYLVPETTDQ